MRSDDQVIRNDYLLLQIKKEDLYRGLPSGRFWDWMFCSWFNDGSWQKIECHTASLGSELMK